jgi:hypothetical protein
VVALLGVNALMALATFLYAFVAHGLSAHFDPEYAMSLVDPRVIYAYGQGTFDLETWACETKDLPHYDEYPAGKVHTLCALEAGARWMTLFVFLAATGLFTLACLDWRGEKFLLTTWKNKRVSWRLDYV